MASSAARALPTHADLARLDPDGAYEILGGEVVEKAAPSGEHGDAQAGLNELVRPPFHRRAGGEGGPGGWWILGEVEVELGPHDLVRPDLVGWRRERLPDRPTGSPQRLRPDWVCEILSPATARRDLGQKALLYHRFEVPWYWTVDPVAGFVQVLRHTPEGYLVDAVAGPGEPARLHPFDAVALDLGRLFGAE